MARVDFYVLGTSGPAARQRFACRLAEKAYRQENSVFILVADEDAGRSLDELLWTFRDGSFVPHEMARAAARSTAAPVCIGVAADNDARRDLLINLGNDIPDSTNAFPRIAEIVTSDGDSLSQSRKRFAAYRDAGHEMETHKL
jgi:DNA polymerase-3 subunit chi